MRTDVKLGVVFALVMVLAAGGYFMFRGEKQTPISLADAGTGTPDTKPQLGKPAAPAKPGVNQPKASTTPSRPAINPKPTPNNINAANRTTTPVNPGVTTPPSPSSEPKPALTGGPASATSPSPNANIPAVATNAPASRPGNLPSPTITPLSTDSSTVIPTTTIPATSPSAAPATSPAVVTNQPVTTSPSPNAGLTGMPNPSTPSSNPVRPTGMTPLTNSPTSNPTTSPAMTALPPGIKTASDTKTESAPVRPESTNAAVETHKVQTGDSLTSLAQTYYGDTKYAKFLANSNPRITDPNRLKVGSLVSIPPLPADTDSRLVSGNSSPNKTADSAIGGKRTYTVKSGDSFYSIAKSQLGNASRWKELLALNNTTVNGDPTSLQPGQRLVLPES